MSFWAKVKQFLGFTGVKVELECPVNISKSAQRVEGVLIVTAKASQRILGLQVKLEEEWSTGKGDEKTEKTFTLGELNLPEPFTIAAGEVRRVPFTLPFQLLKSEADQLQERGGVLGALGTASKWASNERSTYKVSGEADVEGTPIDPSASREVQLVA